MLCYVVLRVRWMIEKDQGFTMNHPVSKHAYPNYLSRKSRLASLR